MLVSRVLQSLQTLATKERDSRSLKFLCFLGAQINLFEKKGLVILLNERGHSSHSDLIGRFLESASAQALR